MAEDSNVYLKIINGKVLAYDLETCTEVEEEFKTGKLYDMVVDEKTWEDNGAQARLVDGNIVLGPDPKMVEEMNKVNVRKIRDKKLERCDRISPMRWADMTEEKRMEWIAYRRALLDIPQQKGFPWSGKPDEIPWPQRPE